MNFSSVDSCGRCGQFILPLLIDIMYLPSCSASLTGYKVHCVNIIYNTYFGLLALISVAFVHKFLLFLGLGIDQ